MGRGPRQSWGPLALLHLPFQMQAKQTLTLLDIQEPLSLHSHHPPSGFLLPEKSHWSFKKQKNTKSVDTVTGFIENRSKKTAPENIRKKIAPVNGLTCHTSRE